MRRKISRQVIQDNHDAAIGSNHAPIVLTPRSAQVVTRFLIVRAKFDQQGPIHHAIPPRSFRLNATATGRTQMGMALLGSLVNRAPIPRSSTIQGGVVDGPRPNLEQCDR